ncbi:hypothetical protein V8V91_18840 [Algoriphagus halophilus]
MPSFFRLHIIFTSNSHFLHPHFSFRQVFLAALISFKGLVIRMIIQLINISKIPPRYSPTTNCQPKKMEMIIPNSMTKLVDASRKAMEEIKLAPFLKSDLVVANAEKLQELLINPNKVPKSTPFPSLPPMVCSIFSSVTKI